MEAHVFVEAHEAPRGLFTTAQKIWRWAPLYTATLIFFLAATMLAFFSIFVDYATPEVTLKSQNSVFQFDHFPDTHDQCQVLVRRGCEALSLDNATTAARVAHLLTESVMESLTGEGQLDASMLAQAGPYHIASCAWAPGMPSPTASFPRTVVPIVTLRLDAMTLPGMVDWNMVVSCNPSRNLSVHAGLTTHATVRYRYRAGARAVRLVQRQHPSQTTSPQTGQSSLPVPYEVLSRYQGLQIVSVVPCVLCTGALALFYVKAVRRYQRGRRELATLQAQARAQQVGVVGHIRAPLGAQVPRARVRDAYEIDTDGQTDRDSKGVDGGQVKSGTRQDNGDTQPSPPPPLSTLEDIEFPYGRGTYLPVDAGVDSDVVSPCAHDERVGKETRSDPVRVASERDAARHADASSSVAVAVAGETSASSGVPLASSVSGENGAARWSSGADVGTSMVRAHAHYQVAMSTLRRAIIVQSFVACVLRLLISVFHLCGTIEHWHYLDGALTSAAASLVPHAMATAVWLNWVSVGLMFLGGLASLCVINVHEPF